MGKGSYLAFLANNEVILRAVGKPYEARRIKTIRLMNVDGYGDIPQDIWEALVEFSAAADKNTREGLKSILEALKKKYVRDSSGRYVKNPDGSYKLSNPKRR